MGPWSGLLRAQSKPQRWRPLLLPHPGTLEGSNWLVVSGVINAFFAHIRTAHNFVIDCALFRWSLNTYPAATGLKPLLEGIGNGVLLQVLVKKTGCVVAGLYIGSGTACGITGVLCGGIASIWLVGDEECRICCWQSGLSGWCCWVWVLDWLLEEEASCCLFFEYSLLVLMAVVLESLLVEKRESKQIQEYDRDMKLECFHPSHVPLF